VPAARPPVRLALLVAVVLLVAVAGVAFANRPAPTPPVGTPAIPLRPPAHHVFTVTTGVTLVVDAGADGLVALDLDDGLARRFTFTGQIDGDRVTQVGDRFVFATSGHVVSVPLSLEGSPQTLGTAPADRFVPAGATDRVWLIEGDPSSGGHVELASLADGDAAAGSSLSVDRGRAVVAGLSDRVLAVSSAPGPPLGWLRLGGERPDVVRGATSCVPPVAQRGPTIVVGADGPACDAVQRVGPDGAVPPIVSIPGLHQLSVLAVAPSGDRAVVTGLVAGGDLGGTWVVDFVSGTTRRLTSLSAASSPVATWAPDGVRLFTVETHDNRTWVALFDTRTGHFEEQPVSLDPVRGAVVDIGSPLTEGVAAVSVDSGPDMATSTTPCIAPVARSAGEPLPPSVGSSTCLVPAAGGG
jgi:hypothetical protein